MKKKYIFERNYFKIYEDKKLFSDKVKNYEVIYFGPRVGVVLTNKSKILLVKQYRYLINNFSFEIPGGSVASGESLEGAAKRELLEESGINITSINHLIDYYPGLDNVDNKTSIFYGEINENVVFEKKIQNDEIESLHWVETAECLDLIKNGEILDAMTSLGILAFSRYTQR
jgi:ADP-ribose pyrophosphatase